MAISSIPLELQYKWIEDLDLKKSGIVLESKKLQIPKNEEEICIENFQVIDYILLDIFVFFQCVLL